MSKHYRSREESQRNRSIILEKVLTLHSVLLRLSLQIFGLRKQNRFKKVNHIHVRIYIIILLHKGPKSKNLHKPIRTMHKFT